MTTPPAGSTPPLNSLDRSALSGIVWAGAAKWSTQLVSWAGTIAVARILVPSDYGLLTMAGVFLGIVNMLSEFGVGTTVITLRELPQQQIRQLHSFSFFLGFSGTLLTALAAYPLGLFFRAPELPPVLLVVGSTFLISSLQTVPAGLLRRELRFRTLALIDISRGLVVPIVTLIGALIGLRYWALALGSVVGSLITTGITLYNRPIPFAKVRLGDLTSVLHFSRHVMLSRLSWIVYANGDFAVAGRRLNKAAVGDYGLAWTIATSPIEKLTMVLSDVTPSLFSAIQGDRPAFRRYFLNLSEIVCLATFPSAVGLALVSHDLVAVLLGEKWSGAAGPVGLLALYAGARSVTTLFGQVLTAARETRLLMLSSLALAVLLLLGFYAGSFWGGAGIAAAWLVVHPAFSCYLFTKIRRILDLRLVDYLQALRLGLDGAVVMAGVLLAFQWQVASAWSPAARLAASILLGAATYAATTWALHRTRLRQIIDWLRRVRRGGAAAA